MAPRPPHRPCPRCRHPRRPHRTLRSGSQTLAVEARMFESFASQSKTTPAEWLLARLTDPARAAAILGDLTELSDLVRRLSLWRRVCLSPSLVSLKPPQRNGSSPASPTLPALPPSSATSPNSPIWFADSRCGGAYV